MPEDGARGLAPDDELLQLAMGDEKAREYTAALRRSEYAKGLFGIIGPANATVWHGERLTARENCLVNLATMAAINRPEELRIRVRGLLCAGMPPEEIAEVFLHTAAYCGFPAGVEAHLTLAHVVEELRAEGILDG
jgi:4-carboxymuconolactone decarboxylase